MKKALMALLAVMLLMGLATGANAAVSNTISFYLVDWPSPGGDNTVTMTANTLGASIGNLKYSLDGNTWIPFSGTGTSGQATIAISSTTHTQLMYLEYGSDQTADTMTFTSFTANSGNNTTPKNLDLYTGLIVNFDSTKFPEITFATNADNDKFAPVPIPAVAWLLGSGLVGLLGIRRRLGA